MMMKIKYHTIYKIWQSLTFNENKNYKVYKKLHVLLLANLSCPLITDYFLKVPDPVVLSSYFKIRYISGPYLKKI